MALSHVNAIVVGSGAGGGVVAKELAVAGLTVVLFERGRWIPYEEHGDDELISQRTTVLGNGLGPDDRTLSPGGGRRRTARRGSSCPATGPTTTSPHASAAGPPSTAPWPGDSCRRISQNAIDVRSVGGLDGRGLANQLRRPRTLLREGGIGGRRVAATTARIPSPRPRKKP